jgi:hypothetical protein
MARAQSRAICLCAVCSRGAYPKTPTTTNERRAYVRRRLLEIVAVTRTKQEGFIARTNNARFT